MRHLKFKKGDFITESSSKNGSFAVFEGEVYEPTKKGELFEYPLMCFYNPAHYTQDSNGEYKKEYVFECDVEDDTCQYIIDENDLNFWRVCTVEEKRDALKFLAEVKRIAFDEVTNTFRKLKENEKITFDAPKTTYNRGSESGGINPFYRGLLPHGPGSVGNSPVVSKKTITRSVDENWEQKEPIRNMPYERIELISKMCEKLKYDFSYSSSNDCYCWPGLYDDYYD
jgi:hypothetical protein